jgi:hypothetical protein
VLRTPASWGRCMSLAVRPWHTGCLLYLLHLSLFFRFVVLNSTGSTGSIGSIGSTGNTDNTDNISNTDNIDSTGSTDSTDNTDNIGNTDQWSQLPRALEGEVKGGSSLEGTGKGRLWRKGSRKRVDRGAQRVNALLSHLSCL